MKKLFGLSAMLALSLSAVAIGTASASNGATVTHFNAAYGVGPTFWTCSGNHIVGPAKHPFVKDTETCLITGNVSSEPTPASYKGDPFGYIPFFGADKRWGSDFEQSLIATSWSMSLTSNGDGTDTLSIVAYY